MQTSSMNLVRAVPSPSVSVLLTAAACASSTLAGVELTAAKPLRPGQLRLFPTATPAQGTWRVSQRSPAVSGITLGPVRATVRTSRADALVNDRCRVAPADTRKAAIEPVGSPTGAGPRIAPVNSVASARTE